MLMALPMFVTEAVPMEPVTLYDETSVFQTVVAIVDAVGTSAGVLGVF
jgi:hypothetical protein